jgi:hypothetical protein
MRRYRREQVLGAVARLILVAGFGRKQLLANNQLDCLLLTRRRHSGLVWQGVFGSQQILGANVPGTDQPLGYQ